MRSYPFLFAFIPFLISDNLASQLASNELKIRIASPKRGSEVASVDTLSGQITEYGQPYILVRAREKKQEGNEKSTWWVQQNVQLDSEGRFRGRVHFGNKSSPDGMEFEVIAILVTEADFARTLQRKYSIDEIPRNVIRSRTLQVTLNTGKKIAPPAGFVTYPANLDLVGRRETLTGIVPKFGRPVVFVRPVGGDGLWWNQGLVTTDASGHFQSDVHFGNATTPDRSQFQIAVVVLDEKLAGQFRTGKTLKTLPRQHLGLQTITVELQHQITDRHANQRKKP